MQKEIQNWTGEGTLIVTSEPVDLTKGDNYISTGFSGKNVFTHDGKATRIAVKVLKVSKDLVWGKSGNNTLHLLEKY